MSGRPWSEDDLAVLRDSYSRINVPLKLRALGLRLGRSPVAITLKAGRIGLTSELGTTRPRVDERKIRKPKFATVDERMAHLSAARKAWLNEHGHPRGAAGLVHTPEARARMGAASRKAWADPSSPLNSEGHRQRQSDAIHALQMAGKMRAGYTRSAGGHREDLGIYVRSSWEANYARFLVWLMDRGEITRWAYESKTFEFSTIKRGTRSYTPDFLVEYPDGRHEWHEVKGWMDQPSRTRLARMAKYYPGETVRVIDKEWFRRMNKGLAGVIPGWERRRM